MKVNGEIVSAPTSKEERDKLWRQFANDPRVKLVERYPESKMKAPKTIPTAKTNTKKKGDLSWIDRLEEMDAFLDD